MSEDRQHFDVTIRLRVSTTAADRANWVDFFGPAFERVGAGDIADVAVDAVRDFLTGEGFGRLDSHAWLEGEDA